MALTHARERVAFQGSSLRPTSLQAQPLDVVFFADRRIASRTMADSETSVRFPKLPVAVGKLGSLG